MDYQALVQAAREYGVLLELNNSSLRPGGSRKDAKPRDVEMLRYCREYQVPVVIGSDAHVDTDIGNHEMALALLEEENFPQELIINRSVEALKEALDKKRAVS